MHRLFFTSVFLITGGGPVTADAASTIPFGVLDVNRDRALTPPESVALPGIEAQWQDLDRDGDGRLNRGEYAGYSLPSPAAGRHD